MSPTAVGHSDGVCAGCADTDRIRGGGKSTRSAPVKGVRPSAAGRRGRQGCRQVASADRRRIDRNRWIRIDLYIGKAVTVGNAGLIGYVDGHYVVVGA